jgi:hypothetical protein
VLVPPPAPPPEIAFADRRDNVDHFQRRERVVLVIDPLSPSAPLASSTLDYETAALLPVVDQERAIVYLAGRGDSIVKYSEFSKNAFAWSAVGIGAPVESLALTPWTKLDVIKGEINRLLVLSKQGDVIPVPVIVPQRFYIDFNEATNPPVRSMGASCSTLLTPLLRCADASRGPRHRR